MYNNTCTIPERLVFACSNIKIPDIPIILCKNIISDIKYLISRYPEYKNYLVVCDNIAYDFWGKDIVSAFNCDALLLGEKPEALYSKAHAISKDFVKYDYIIVLGAGTVVNIAKYAASIVDKPYCIIPTAPSTSGYTSSISVLQNKEIKSFFRVNLPHSIYVDYNIISAAPTALIIKGINECLSYYFAEMDWMVSNFFSPNSYNKDLYDFLKPYLQNLVALLLQVGLKSRNFIIVLVECLLACGLVNYISNGGHLLQSTNNIMLATNMLYNNKSATSMNCGVVSNIFVYRLQKYLLSRTPVMYNNTNIAIEDIPDFIKDVLSYKNKFDFRNFNYKLAVHWEEISNKFKTVPDILKIYKEINQMLTYKDLFISRTLYHKIIKTASFMNSSFNFLDIAVYGDVNFFNLMN